MDGPSLIRMWQKTRICQATRCCVKTSAEVEKLGLQQDRHRRCQKRQRRPVQDFDARRRHHHPRNAPHELLELPDPQWRYQALGEMDSNPRRQAQTKKLQGWAVVRMR